MTGRQAELTAFGPDVIRLAAAEALSAFRLAAACSSRSRYGLDEMAFDNIDRLDARVAGPAAHRWLAERVGAGELLMVFAEDEVYRVPAALLLDHWQDLLCPSRDDAVILPANGGWALFYCHEDEFEFARGGSAEIDR